MYGAIDHVDTVFVYIFATEFFARWWSAGRLQLRYLARPLVAIDAVRMTERERDYIVKISIVCIHLYIEKNAFSFPLPIIVDCGNITPDLEWIIAPLGFWCGYWILPPGELTPMVIGCLLGQFGIAQFTFASDTQIPTCSY